MQTGLFTEDNLADVVKVWVWETLDDEQTFGVGSTISSWILNSSEAKSASEFEGKYLCNYALASDSGANGVQFANVSQCISYNPTTKAASVITPAMAAPTGYYRRLASRYPVTVKRVTEWGDEVSSPDQLGRPSQAYLGDYQASWDSSTGFGTYKSAIQFDCTADKTYIMEWIYYVNLQLVNLADARYAAILRRWKALFTQGLFVWLLADNTDDRHDTQAMIMGQMISTLGGQDIEGHDMSDLQRSVED
jgi:hypothetical protein